MINAYEQYRQGSVATATPEGLTLMLYEGLVRFMKQGRLFIQQNRLEQAHRSIIRVQDIIDELNGSLNMDYEISHQLRSLYLFIQERLVEANINKDLALLDEILPLAEELRDTWKEAMQIARGESRARQMQA
jgi:flagellar protein FliS